MSAAPAAVEGVSMATGDLLGQVRAAREGAVLLEFPTLGHLRVRGKDGPDLLHRLTTNDIKGLRPGQGAVAVFATAKGRILDLVTVYRLEDGIFVLAGEGRGPAVRDWIERYTFREDVNVEDLGPSWGTLGVFGAKAQRLVAALFGSESAERPRHHPLVLSFSGVEAILARTYPLGGEGFLLTAATAGLSLLREKILAAPENAMPAGAECFETLRIEAGLPRQGHELTEDYNPWEARLQDAISLTKGCYVGQEVIARLNTYKKVSKHLVRMSLAAATAPAAGTPLRRDGRAAGTLTSAAWLPGEDRVVALGYVREEDVLPGTLLAAGPEDRPFQLIVLGFAR